MSSELLFGRKLKTKLPEIGNEIRLDEEIRERDTWRKLKGKDYYDSINKARESIVKIEDTVLVQKVKENKLSADYEKDKFIVRDKQGNTVTVEPPSGVIYKRNTEHVKPICVKQVPIDPIVIDDSLSDNEVEETTENPKEKLLPNTSIQNSTAQQVSRDTRDKVA